MNNSLQIKRIQNEIIDMKRNPSDMYVASPLENDLRTWHFTIRGPKDSDFEEGIYHGKIELSSEYPIKPPNLYFLTANGRFELNTKICLNITKFHKESWNPAFTIKTMLEALINYFPIREEGFAGVGALDYPSGERKKLAILSQKARCDKCGPLNQILPVLKKGEEKLDEKKEEAKVDDPLISQENNNNEKEEDLFKKAFDDEKLKDKLKHLKESIKEQQSKLDLPFLRGSFNDLQKKKENQQMRVEETEKNEPNFTFDNVLTELNLLQEVVKSIKFTKHPLNATDVKKENENEKPKEKEIPKNQPKNESLIPEKKNSENEENEEIRNLNDLDQGKKKEEQDKAIDEKPEVVQAKNTLKVFDTIVRVVKIIILLAIVAFIYS